MNNKKENGARIDRFLNLLIGFCIALCVGNAIYTVWQYSTDPAYFEVQSAPWYFGIISYCLLTAVLVAVTFFIKKVVKGRYTKL